MFRVSRIKPKLTKQNQQYHFRIRHSSFYIRHSKLRDYPSATTDGSNVGAVIAGTLAQVPPKAFLNYILFDDNYVPYDFGYDQIGTEGAMPGSTSDKMNLVAKVSKPGYIYIYLSNENEIVQEVYFDDLAIKHVKGVAIQQNDYYPFGLTFNSYQRENSVDQRWKFQGQEHIDDLGLNWDSFKWRNHQPDIGRFFNIDPLANEYVHNSPYAFSENKVTSHVELEGLEAVDIQLRQDDLDRASGKMSKQEFRERQAARAVGAAIGVAIVVIVRASGVLELFEGLLGAGEGAPKEPNNPDPAPTESPQPTTSDHESPDGFTDPQSDDDLRYQTKDQKRAPEQSSPYDIREKKDEDGNLKQVTTYDEHGNRDQQYDLQDKRHGEQA